MPTILHKTDLGVYYHGKSDELLKKDLELGLRGKVQLIITSPPFPLNNKKSYGNLKGEEYKEWFISLAPIFSDLLTPNGSIVIEIGNAWEPGRPVQSLLPLECLLGFVKEPISSLRLCQEFICYNPARLPSPAQWVTIERSRVTDSYTHVWWMSCSDNPKADNKKALRPYSKQMKKLIERQSYNSGKRPSQHQISEKSFLTDHGGSIAHNLFEIDPIESEREVRLPNAFSFGNTSSSDQFSKACREKGIIPHPARMPMGLASFFIEFLTDPGDIVLDPFAGSNTTGFVAESLGRKWVGVDAKAEYAEQSKIRFENLNHKITKEEKDATELHFCN